MNTIDIEGIDKAHLLASFYNGALETHASRAQNAQRGLSVQQAREIIGAESDDSPRANLMFSYLKGKELKIDLSGDEVDVELYDKANGPGKGVQAVDVVRPNGKQRNLIEDILGVLEGLISKAQDSSVETVFRKSSQPIYWSFLPVIRPSLGRRHF